MVDTGEGEPRRSFIVSRTSCAASAKQSESRAKAEQKQKIKEQSKAEKTKKAEGRGGGWGRDGANRSGRQRNGAHTRV